MQEGNKNEGIYNLLCFISRFLKFYVMLGLLDLGRKKCKCKLCNYPGDLDIYSQLWI